MKKLFALVMVLGIASMASAALSVDILKDGNQWDGSPLLPSEVLEITVIEDTGLQGFETKTYWFGFPVAMPGELQDAVVLPGAGSLGSTNFYADTFGYTGYDLIAANGTDVAIPGGDQFTVFFHCAGEGDVVIDLYEYEADPANRMQITIPQIPEPITMTLLGLGGLGILRRRR